MRSTALKKTFDKSSEWGVTMNTLDQHAEASALRSPESTLLIADQQDTFCGELKKASIALGINVHCAHELGDAVRCIEEIGPDFVVLGQQLATDRLLELINLAKNANRKAKCVVVTRYPSLVGAVNAIKQGAWDYLAKPASAEVLLSILTGYPNKADFSPERRQPLSVNRLEWEHICRVLDLNGQNISASARALGMHRRTLQRKLAKYPALR